MTTILKYLQPKLYSLSNGLFANWKPDNHVAVGDFGFIRRGGFERVGSLQEYGAKIEAKPATTDGKNEFEYKDKIDLSVNLMADASVARQGAKIGITIKDKGAFLYHLSDVKQIRPPNQRVFEEEVAKVIVGTELDWDEELVLVTEVQQAAKATIIASEGSDGKLELQTNFDPTGSAFLSGAKGKVSIGSSAGSMFSWIARGNTVTLLKLVRPVLPPPTGPGNARGSVSAGILAWARDVFKRQNLVVADLVIRHVQQPQPGLVIAIGAYELVLSMEAITVDEVIATVADEAIEDTTDDDNTELAIEHMQVGKRQMTG